MSENFNQNEFIIDRSAWIEYFNGTQKGAKAKTIIENSEKEIFTVDICLAEIKFWSLNQKKEFKKLHEIILSNSQIIETNSTDWLKAAEIKFEKRKTTKDFGLVDAAILAKSAEFKTQILTTDKHFEREKNVKLL